VSRVRWSEYHLLPPTLPRHSTYFATAAESRSKVMTEIQLAAVIVAGTQLPLYFSIDDLDSFKCTAGIVKEDEEC
jgi:hypothetical protein